MVVVVVVVGSGAGGAVVGVVVTVGGAGGEERESEVRMPAESGSKRRSKDMEWELSTFLPAESEYNLFCKCVCKVKL